MSQFAWPIYGLELTSAIQGVWSITDDYAMRILGLLYNIQNNEASLDSPLEIYNPNDEDWYEAYYGVEIGPNDTFDIIKEKYDNKLNNIILDFHEIKKVLSKEETPEKKRMLAELFDEMDVRNSIEAGDMIKDLVDYIKKTPPQFLAVFTF